MWMSNSHEQEGRYEYKYIVDGEWTLNKHELITNPNQDGHVNNYVEVDLLTLFLDQIRKSL